MTSPIFLIAIMLAAPVSPAAQTEQPRPPMDSNERRICRAVDTIGTRLGRVVRCRTQAEWEQFARENGQTVDRMQRVGLHCKPWGMC